MRELNEAQKRLWAVMGKDITELEAVNCSQMTELEFRRHDQKIRDLYWSRRYLVGKLGEEKTAE